MFYKAPHSWGFLFVGGWVDLDMSKITRFENHKGELVEIKKMLTTELKREIEIVGERIIYDYKGEWIIENMYIKCYGYETPLYKALVEELESREND